MKTKYSDPAFPENQFDDAINKRGLTIREYFAIKALAGLLANPNYEIGTSSRNPKYITAEAVSYADDLIQALNISGYRDG